MTHDPVQAWLNAAGRFPVLPKGELIRLAKKRDTLAEGSADYVKVINKICQHNLRLIPRVVAKYVSKRKDLRMCDTVVSDLLQQGYIGLRRAAELFDAGRGYTFSTYSSSWIHQSIYRWHNSRDRAVYIPENTIGEIFYRNRHGKPSSSKTGRTGEAVLNAARRCLMVTSVDIKANDEDDATIADLLSGDNRIIDPKSELPGAAELRLRDTMAACGIRPKVQDIVASYAKRGNMTVVAARLSLSRKHCQNLYSEAIRTMRHKVESGTVKLKR